MNGPVRTIAPHMSSCGCPSPLPPTGHGPKCTVIEHMGRPLALTARDRDFVRQRCVLTDDDLAWARTRTQATA